jgi:photosystem II stability/assembly factor-like uncharacterized protein
MARRAPRGQSAQFRHLWGGVIQRIFVLDANRAWTGEEGGRIRRTTDGGNTWTFQRTPDAVDGYVRGLHFLRRGPQAGLAGWAVGSNGQLIATTDAGATWSPVGEALTYPAGDPRAGLPVDLWDVFFQDALNGWVAGIRALLRTSDGGQTWTDLLPLNPNLPRTAEFYRIAFAGSGPAAVGVALAEPGIVARSLDGTTWSTVLSIPDFCPTVPDHLEPWDVQFEPTADPSTAVGYAVGGQGNQCGGFLATADGGLTWTVETSSALPPTLYGVAPLSAGAALACGYGGRALLRNPGTTPVWQDVSSRLEPPEPTVRVPLWGVGSDGASTAWIVGLMSMAYRTSDRGATFVRQLGAGAWRMRDVHFVDASNGWAVAQELAILRTQDGGATWTEAHAVRGAQNLNSIRMRDADRGVAVGNGRGGGFPALFHYDTAHVPARWRESTVLTPATPPPRDNGLWSAAWAAPATNDVWAVGTRGWVMRSVDGFGRTWTRFPAPAGAADVDFLSIAFDGVDALYAVGVRRADVRVQAFRLRYPALAWEDLSPRITGTWQAVAAQGSEVYVVGSAPPAQGCVYKFDTTSPPDAPRWELVFPTPGSPAPQALMTAALTGSGATLALFAGGERGFVLRLQGGTWSALKSQTSVTLTGMSFLNPDLGFAVGHGSIDGSGVGSSAGLGDSALVGFA